MRVHAFARRFPSLSQTFVLNQWAGLLSLGVDLTVFADGADSTGFTHPDVVDSGLPSRTRHFPTPGTWWRRPVPALQLLAEGAPLTLAQWMALLDPRRGGLEALSGRLLFAGASVAREDPPDVLHAHFGPVGAMVEALRAAGVVDAPLVTTFYGYDAARTPSASYERLFRHGDVFLVLGEAMRARLIAMGAPAERIHVHRLGIDLARFAPATCPERDAGRELHVLSIARLVPKKGLADAMRAVARARATMPRLRYTIVGDGPLRGELEALAESLGITSVVHFAGWKAQPDVLSIARTAHVLLAPSVTAADGDAEGTPVAILEAQALGLPVVATRHAGIPGVVLEGESAILVEEHAVEALATALQAVVDPTVARRMGEAGRAFVEQHHDIRGLNDALLARYRSLAGG